MVLPGIDRARVACAGRSSDQPAGGGDAAGIVGLDAGLTVGGDTTLSIDRTIAPGSARLWFVSTAIVIPSTGKCRTAPRK